MRLISFLALIAFLLSSTPTYASDWFYPMEDYHKRITLKGFGDQIDDKFYKGKEHLFPFNRFYGYHSAVDLEYLDGEKNKLIPIFAVADGKITYIGRLNGYGGIILENLEGEGKTALYGHVKLNNLKIKNGQKVEAGQIITYLGDEFSSETSKERKHLHFGIYNGEDLYFKGHETNLTTLKRKWINPTEFLMEKGAKNPRAEESPRFMQSLKPSVIVKNEEGFLEFLLRKLSSFFKTFLNE